MKRLNASIWITSLLLTCSTANLLLAKDKGDRGQFSASDYKFACAAARGGMAEVKGGEIARTQASDSQVKQFGEMMVTDHTKAGDELKALAGKKGAVLPSELSKKEQRSLDRLQKWSGHQFDKAYMESMVDDHKKDLKEFQKAAEHADDPELKAFAAKTASVVSGHLEKAKQIHTKLKTQTSAK